MDVEQVYSEGLKNEEHSEDNSYYADYLRKRLGHWDNVDEIEYYAQDNKECDEFNHFTVCYL